MIIPGLFVAAAVAIAAGWTFFITASKVKKEPLSPEHQEIYNTAVKKVTDVPKLNALADAFAAAGKPVHAEALKQVADLHASKPGKPKPKKKLVKQHGDDTEVVATGSAGRGDAPPGAVQIAGDCVPEKEGMGVEK